jgi:hypothetical protein
VHLWGRRRTALAALSTVALAAGLAVGVASLAAAGTDLTAGTGPLWTIAFRSAGPDCTSRPDPPSLTVAAGTVVALVNETGEAAVLDAGYTKPPTVADGDSYSLLFNLGAHAVRMVPQCAGSREADTATIYVEKSLVSAGPGPSGPSTAAWSSAGAAGSPAAPSTVIHPVDTSLPDTGSASPSYLFPWLNDPPSPVLGGAAPRGIANPVGDNSDGKGVELVGVVALICILGVGVGIIRVIRARHANGAQ